MSQPSVSFAGASKINRSPLDPLERQLDKLITPRFPHWIETYHLTLFSVVWCIGIIAFSLAARHDMRWLWGVSLMIFLQFFTDFFDGKLGKWRATGLVRWGFYLDHFFDYIFLAALAIGYAVILPASAHLSLFVTFIVFAAYMVHSFLIFSTTDEFQISSFRLGPTEFRFALIIINTLLIFNGTRLMIRVLPFVAGGAFIGLCLQVYLAQRKLWHIDMRAKANAEKPNHQLT